MPSVGLTWRQKLTYRQSLVVGETVERMMLSSSLNAPKSYL